METYSLKHLLDQILSINTRYQKINELTGENFNVFRILKLESSEVRMHSAFIGELLNPKASHGQQDTFLKLFIKSFCFKQNEIDTASCTVEIEKYIGRISADKTTGGRIDILITDKHGKHIVIENKIYAGDQDYQLQRYHAHNPKADLIYLSLHGKEPEEYSKGSLLADIDYRCCSYNLHIADWLEACRKEVAVLPIIRESLTQYLNLIKYLTNQTLNDTMKEEVASLLSANLEASFIIADNLDNALKVILDKFIVQLGDIAEELGLEFDNNVHYLFKVNYRGFWFWKNSWENVCFNFQFQGYDKSLVYGFSAKSDQSKPNSPITLPTELKSQLRELGNPNNKDDAWWPLVFKFDEQHGNWEKYDAWKAVEDGTMAQLFKDKLVEFITSTKDMQL